MARYSRGMVMTVKVMENMLSACFLCPIWGLLCVAGAGIAWGITYAAMKDVENFNVKGIAAIVLVSLVASVVCIVRGI